MTHESIVGNLVLHAASLFASVFYFGIDVILITVNT